MGREINPFIIPSPVTIVTDEAEFAECVKSLGAEPPSIEGDAITVAVRDQGERDHERLYIEAQVARRGEMRRTMKADVIRRAKRLAGIEGKEQR